MVRKHHAAVVHGRDQRAHAASSRPSSSAAIANANATEKPDVAHVEHRRVDHHARVLQQRIQVAAVGGGGQQALERVRGEQHEEQEPDAHQAHHAEHARDACAPAGGG